MVPVGFRETLDGWSPPVSSAGYIFFLSDALFRIMVVRIMVRLLCTP